MRDAGLFDSEGEDLLVGLDLEWSGPQYPSKKSKKGRVYDASVLILSTFKGTAVINLYQYQDTNSDGVHFPGPYLPRVQDKRGHWVVRTNKCWHGSKWKMPETIARFFQQEKLIVTGRSIKADITRLNNVFYNPDDEDRIQVKMMDVSELATIEPYKTQKDHASSQKKRFANGLSDWLLRCTKFEMEDKGQRSEIRTGGWMVHTILSAQKIRYAAHDGMASYILGHQLQRGKRDSHPRNNSRKRKASANASPNNASRSKSNAATRQKGRVSKNRNASLSNNAPRKKSRQKNQPEPFTTLFCFDPTVGYNSLYSCMNSSGDNHMLPTPLKNNAGTTH